MRFALPALLLLSACAGDPGRDPIQIADRYGGPSFAELLEVRLWDSTIVFCSGVQGLNLYDIGPPGKMNFVDRVGFSGGSLAYPRCQHLAVAPDDDRIYAAAHADEFAPRPFISVIDASNPRTLSETDIHFFDEQIEGVEVIGDTLYAAAHSAGVLVMERNGDGLEVVQTLDGFANAWTIRADGDVAYVADGQGGLHVLDVSSPAAPNRLATLELPGVTKDVAFGDNRLYAALGSAGVALVDISDPAAPTLIEVENTPGSALAVGWGASVQAVYVSDWNDVLVYDRTDPDDLVRVGREPVADGNTETRSLGLTARDDIIYSSNWTEMVSYRFHPDRPAPDLMLTPSSITMPPAGAGETTEQIFRIDNLGNAPLIFEDVIADTRLEVEEFPALLEPGEGTNITVAFSAPNDSLWTGTIRIRSDDPDQPAQVVDVLANGFGLGVGDRAPDWTFNTIEGGTVQLSEIDGPVLLAYFATF